MKTSHSVSNMTASDFQTTKSSPTAGSVKCQLPGHRLFRERFNWRMALDPGPTPYTESLGLTHRLNNGSPYAKLRGLRNGIAPERAPACKALRPSFLTGTKELGRPWKATRLSQSQQLIAPLKRQEDCAVPDVQHESGSRMFASPVAGLLNSRWNAKESLPTHCSFFARKPRERVDPKLHVMASDLGGHVYAMSRLHD